MILKQADICSSFIRDFLTTSTACLLLFASGPDLHVGVKPDKWVIKRVLSVRTSGKDASFCDALVSSSGKGGKK